ncbi:MAG: hypothetical protein A3H98_08770 [Bacteroidetes bacterium RIFCSPLOWO2_02_FULL_36_8]|nr:MAG: hypothetical protein A3H98_08770 [Bacteroidetes bacterium RIFCSPLOWO2_02_FULL_36_8]OFY71971.1 MAG: hypothetical protein A3G23_00050 [Bacteroidetes bacterium RIFCSPLOWO2_12_FULL_37_12]
MRKHLFYKLFTFGKIHFLFFVTGILLTCANFLEAQNVKQFQNRLKSFRFGCTAGFNFSDFYKTSPFNDPFNAVNTSGNDPYLFVDFGFMAGGLIIFQMKRRVDVTAELQYSQKGGSFNDNGFIHRLSLHYLDFQILPGIRFLDRFNVKAGASGSLLVFVKAMEGRVNVNTDKEPYSPNILNGIFSLGYTDYSGVFFEGRAEMGFSNINNTSYPGKDFFLGSLVWQLNIGYIF